MLSVDKLLTIFFAFKRKTSTELNRRKITGNSLAKQFINKCGPLAHREQGEPKRPATILLSLGLKVTEITNNLAKTSVVSYARFPPPTNTHQHNDKISHTQRIRLTINKRKDAFVAERMPA